MKRVLEGRSAVVTGGASGIGRATALVFAREGAKVVVADVAEKGGQETVRLIQEAGGDALFVKCDVTKAKDVETMVKRTVDHYGRLDCAFNNAGIGAPGTTADCTEEDWDRTISVNLKGVWLCMKYEILEMVKQGGGIIVNTASAGGLIGTPGVAAYTASKHGVVGLTKTAAVEYVKAGIRINAICPGSILTPMIEASMSAHPELTESVLSKHPIGRFGRPEEIAEAVLWLCSDAASFVVGSAFSVDGGVVAQ